MRGREETQREWSMVDFRAETAISSDKTEFTETEDQSRTHHMRTTYIEAPVLAADTLQRTRQPTVQRFKNALQLTSHASRSALLKLKF